jgi:ADP-heptose:LPS heptosyltransferase
MLKPLVIYHKQLGDVLLMEPALAKLASAMGSDVMLVTRPKFSPMVALMDRVVPCNRMPIRRATQVISFDSTTRASLMALTTLASNKKLILPQPTHFKKWHKLIFSNNCTFRDDTAEYRAQYFYNVMPCSSTLAFRPPRLQKPPMEWLPNVLPAKYIIIHATSAWQRKSWPSESWAQVIRHLHALGVAPIVLTGGTAPWEKEYIIAIKKAAGIPLVDLSGRTSLKNYLAVIAGAEMVLCVDGSASHLAAAFNCPSVTLFGPTHPLHWHFSSPISELVDAREYSQERRPNVDLIPVERVICSINRIFNRYT